MRIKNYTKLVIGKKKPKFFTNHKSLDRSKSSKQDGGFCCSLQCPGSADC